jgi:hypothetical protein
MIKEYMQLCDIIDAEERRDMKAYISIPKKALDEILYSLETSIEALNDRQTIKMLCKLIQEIESIEDALSEVHN